VKNHLRISGENYRHSNRRWPVILYTNRRAKVQPLAGSCNSKKLLSAKRGWGMVSCKTIPCNKRGII